MRVREAQSSPIKLRTPLPVVQRVPVSSDPSPVDRLMAAWDAQGDVDEDDGLEPEGAPDPFAWLHTPLLAVDEDYEAWLAERQANFLAAHPAPEPAPIHRRTCLDDLEFPTMAKIKSPPMPFVSETSGHVPHTPWTEAELKASAEAHHHIRILVPGEGDPQPDEATRAASLAYAIKNFPWFAPCQPIKQARKRK